MTRAEYLRHAHAHKKIPSMDYPAKYSGLIGYFNAIRQLAGITDNPITMATIKDWQSHSCVELERWERDCIFAMDRAFRRACSDVIKYHAARKQVGVKKDKDRGRYNG